MGKVNNFYLDTTVDDIVQELETTVLELCGTDDPAQTRTLCRQLATNQKELTIFLGLCGRRIARQILSKKLQQLDTIFPKETRYASEYKVLKAIYDAEAQKIGLEEF